MPFDIAGMWEKTQAMLRDSLDAMVNMDGPLANDVCRRDNEVDRIKRDIRRRGGADSPRAGKGPAADAPAGRLPQLGADRRLRHEHRRGRDLHVAGRASSVTTNPTGKISFHHCRSASSWAML